MISRKELVLYIWQFIKLQRWTFLFICLLDALAWPLDALLWPYILNVVIDIFTRFDTNRLAAWEALTYPIIAGLCLVTFVEVASRTMGFLLAKALPKLQAAIRMTLFEHIQRHSPRYFNERFAGSLANKITDMTSHVDLILQQLFWPLIPASSACLLGCVFLWRISPIFSAILLIWSFLHIGICLKFTRRVDLYEHEHGQVRSSLLGNIVDSLTNNFAVNLFYRFKHERNLLNTLQTQEETLNKASKCCVEKIRCALSLFHFVAVVLGVFGSLLYLWTHGKISTGEVIQVFVTIWSLTVILWSVGSALPVLFQSFGMAQQAYLLLKDPQDLGDKLEAKELKVTAGAITFDAVSFHYGNKKLFEHLCTHIRAGEKVGLVGFTGAGKSSFINLILRFYPLHAGKILIDGQDIAELSLESLRRHIALIPQDPLLFHRTLRDNIAYGNPQACEAEILHAAKLAHCDEFIRHIPQRYDAKVGERGTRLSGGEKQRIAIARAILANAPILILDEATSSLDSITEKYIQESLKTLMQGRTTIVIAHRLSTLSFMDRILVFDQGKIVEEGTHDTLMSEQGLYAKMWGMQAGGFLPDTAH